MWRTAHSFWMLQDMQHFQHGLCNKVLQLQNAVYCSYFCLKTAGETQGEALLLLITLGSLPVTVLNRWSTKRGASARFWSCSIYCVTSCSSHRTFTVKLMSYRWGVFASMIITLASLSLSLVLSPAHTLNAKELSSSTPLYQNAISYHQMLYD